MPVPFTFAGARPKKLAARTEAARLRRRRVVLSAATWKTEVASASAVGSERRTGPELAVQIIEILGHGLTQAISCRPTKRSVSARHARSPTQWRSPGSSPTATTSIKIASALRATRRTIQVGAPTLPKGKPKHDEYFGDTEVYYEVLEATLPIARAAKLARQTRSDESSIRACAEGGLCYNPITKNVSIELPPTNVAIALPAAPRRQGLHNRHPAHRSPSRTSSRV